MDHIGKTALIAATVLAVGCAAEANLAGGETVAVVLTDDQAGTIATYEFPTATPAFASAIDAQFGAVSELGANEAGAELLGVLFDGGSAIRSDRFRASWHARLSAHSSTSWRRGRRCLPQAGCYPK